MIIFRAMETFLNTSPKGSSFTVREMSSSAILVSLPAVDAIGKIKESIWRRPAGEGFKPVKPALIKSQCGEHSGKGLTGRDRFGIRETSTSERQIYISVYPYFRVAPVAEFRMRSCGYAAYINSFPSFISLLSNGLYSPAVGVLF